MGIGKKGTKSQAKSDQCKRKDRRSATGMSGEPKKGGHGGKFTWAGPGSVDGEMKNGAIDVKDPNFEEEEEMEVQD
jgi:hypothetical protein